MRGIITSIAINSSNKERYEYKCIGPNTSSNTWLSYKDKRKKEGYDLIILYGGNFYCKFGWRKATYSIIKFQKIIREYFIHKRYTILLCLNRSNLNQDVMKLITMY